MLKLSLRYVYATLDRTNWFRSCFGFVTAFWHYTFCNHYCLHLTSLQLYRIGKYLKS